MYTVQLLLGEFGIKITLKHDISLQHMIGYLT